MRIVALIVFIVVACAGAQESRRPGSGLPQIENESRCNADDWICRQQEKDAEKQRQRQRFEQLKTDTGKLLALAEELKRNVDASNEHTLSVTVVKKAEEIERLAKSVKDKMRGW